MSGAPLGASEWEHGRCQWPIPLLASKTAAILRTTHFKVERRAPSDTLTSKNASSHGSNIYPSTLRIWRLSINLRNEMCYKADDRKAYPQGWCQGWISMIDIIPSTTMATPPVPRGHDLGRRRDITIPHGQWMYGGGIKLANVRLRLCLPLNFQSTTP